LARDDFEHARPLLVDQPVGQLVSNAGMPLIWDPGSRLVHSAVAAGVPVQPVPGPSATLAALSASGLPTDSFHFAGFLPSKPGQRVHTLEALRDETSTLFFYEAPHRLLEALTDIQAVLGERDVVVAREITKVHEEFVHGAVGEILASVVGREAVKGEITILVTKAIRPKADNRPIEEAVEAQMRAGKSRMEAMKAVLIKPDTVVGWYRAGFCWYRRRRFRRRCGDPDQGGDSRLDSSPRTANPTRGT
jgi:16S rRNA (cytidine1402-2'-O)-methyltransferase